MQTRPPPLGFSLPASIVGFGAVESDDSPGDSEEPARSRAQRRSPKKTPKAESGAVARLAEVLLGEGGSNDSDGEEEKETPLTRLLETTTPKGPSGLQLSTEAAKVVKLFPRPARVGLVELMDEARGMTTSKTDLTELAKVYHTSESVRTTLRRRRKLTTEILDGTRVRAPYQDLGQYFAHHRRVLADDLRLRLS